ncbi:MAG: geranylgeranylglyceryl/heptaprenylglyceryl phosphate synthase [Flavobacteriales bacterium CG_4_9_14_0_2_um_filter_35_242]|nr:geranylgeranylglyceryl/heptaprenylglyceryl phosphate synthase [Zetaproteobacteria bacterium]NDK17493.1 geranylgeranylglyceryl/heptaprenylglyceryl phosphate synthase [Flavobacteriales bacterium]OIO12866.1 MAG: geranylgeranylglyceryl/heptaprenylglyceryl phosphate synthase [Flavobacteriaceae bacterium CG1_02_35_72]PIV17264.1 MAG: geranylgeranylglyceryl/heptaprenylglyceryl phosphate synthase [Flavobacteriales bacterium CG03_land_8_20_14_0_80_35_15]PIX06988.1 MAG: geranylgeranylglyceryl/heptapren
MISFLNQLKTAKKEGIRLLAILLDPDKILLESVAELGAKIEALAADFIFVGGSLVKKGVTEQLVIELKKQTNLKIILFPGDYSQIAPQADALLFLSLISGNNPEYLINQQVKAVSKIQESKLEIIPTAYILIDGGKVSSVEKISKTKPISQHQNKLIVNTALAGQFMGNQLVYLEAGSGAKNPVKVSIIKKVASQLQIPIIVGGGIHSAKQLNQAYKNGANLVVIGTAFEENALLLKSQ